MLGVSELEAGDPPVAGDVVDLLGDLRVGVGGWKEMVSKNLSLMGWGGGGDRVGRGERRGGETGGREGG